MLPNNVSNWPPTPKTRRSTQPTRLLIAAALVGSLIGIGVVCMAGGLPPPSATSGGVSGDAPADAATQQAIRHVIQQAGDAQTEAIATGDPSPMADSATSGYYHQLVHDNQDLLDNGVTAIELVAREWGTITSRDRTATATVYETWSTTHSDTTTEQSRARAVYTLVQSGDTWRIQSDAHPDDNQSPPPAGGDPAPAGQPGPAGGAGPASHEQSRNWSGYAATGGTYTGVSATWSVPQFAPDSPAGVDAAWVGIGGVRSQDLIQAGTQQTVSGNGRTRYESWIEVLPQPSRSVPLAVNAGDSISVSISQQAPDRWLLVFTNTTTRQVYQVTEQYVSSVSSAEWVEEAPTAGRGRLLPLDNFGTITFSQAYAVKDGRAVSIGGAGGRAITMIGAGGEPLAEPSLLGVDGASFTISRTSNPARLRRG
jgi:Peptidase A4 family